MTLPGDRPGRRKSSCDAERVTPQRAAIWKALCDEARPLAPMQLLASARRLVPRLGLATVYRTLKNLIAEGVVTQVELPGDVTHYEITNGQHHHHFHCRSCQSVYEVTTCNVEVMTPPGFHVESHSLILYGYCVKC